MTSDTLTTLCMAVGIQSLGELIEFCEQARATLETGTDLNTVYLERPLDLWLQQATLTDGSTTYDLIDQMTSNPQPADEVS